MKGLAPAAATNLPGGHDAHKSESCTLRCVLRGRRAELLLLARVHQGGIFLDTPSRSCLGSEWQGQWHEALTWLRRLMRIHGGKPTATPAFPLTNCGLAPQFRPQPSRTRTGRPPQFETRPCQGRREHSGLLSIAPQDCATRSPWHSYAHNRGSARETCPRWRVSGCVRRGHAHLSSKRSRSRTVRRSRQRQLQFTPLQTSKDGAAIWRWTRRRAALPLRFNIPSAHVQIKDAGMRDLAAPSCPATARPA